MIYNVTPLSKGFMLTSILGFIVTFFFVFPRSIYSLPDGSSACYSIWFCSISVALLFFFIIMFIASIISMTYTPLDVDMDGLRLTKKK